MFITRTTIDNIVMWVIQLHTADLVCSKTQILLVTLRTQNQPQVDTYVFSEVEHVQEANISVSKFYGNRCHFTGCCFANGRYPCS